ENQIGGGPLDLLCLKAGVANREAATWLLNNVGIDIQPDRSQHKRVVATYDYRDAGGVLRYQAVRYQPKSFSQRRPDGSGGWINNMEGVQRLPAAIGLNLAPVAVKSVSDSHFDVWVGLFTVLIVGLVAVAAPGIW